MAQPKTKLRTSEDVYKRLKFVVEWDENSVYHGEQDLWIGYEDGLYGPMEQRLSAFVPMKEGGDIPLHSIWYFRCADQIVWDRRRRLDELWQSGETPAIHAAQRGQKPKDFDAAADQRAARETAAAIEQARTTMTQNEVERQTKLAEQQKLKQRQQAQRQKEKEKRERRVLAEQRPLPGAVDEEVLTLTSAGADPNAVVRPQVGLRVVTWNALNDDHAAELPPHAASVERAPGLARAVLAAWPDVVAMQEATPAVIAAVDEMWPGGWRTNAPGQLVVWSRYPITQALSVELGPNTSKRALLAELAVRRRAVAIACVHLTSDRRGDKLVDNSEKRAAQARFVREALAGFMPRVDAFVCGDFNEPGAGEVQAGAACMQGLSDAWLAVHGEGDPGFTFDPARNALAQAGSINRAPRRLDRLFASPPWRPEAAEILGEGGEHSDHFGVAATFALDSALGAAPVHTSAVVLLPPEHACAQIELIRERFDPSFGRWMPHLNVLYGFLPEELFPTAAVAMEASVRRHGPFEVRLEELAVFEHGRSASLVIVPGGRDAIVALQHDLEADFPACVEQSSRGAGFQPHLTLGKFDSAEEARRWKCELEQTWVPVSFVVEDAALIARAGDAPFGVRARVPLGSALGARDCALLQALEAGSSGARAFALGSAALLGSDRPPSSDLDVLLVGTRGRDEVFQMLETSMRASWVRRAEGNFPVLQMEVDGTHLDIQYARSEGQDHPLRWPNGVCSEGGTAAAALRDFHALRAAVLAARGVTGWQLFKHASLKVKKWAKARFIDSNALGYLGGWSWSLLLANALLHSEARGAGGSQQQAADADALVSAMCRRFTEWAWPALVVMGSESPSAPQGALMPILCPTDPYANSARNVTASTFVVLRAELARGAAGSPTARPFAKFNVFVRCEVTASGSGRAVCAGWLEARLIVLVRSLDHLGVRPLKVAPGLWAIGVPADTAQLRWAVDEFRERVLRDDQEVRWQELIEIAIEDRETMQRAWQHSRQGASASSRRNPQAPQ